MNPFADYSAVESIQLLIVESMDIETTIIVTNYGPVKGIKKMSATGVNYYSFQRIPYARPPTGKLRFKVVHLLSEIVFPKIAYWISRILNRLNHGQKN